MRNRAAALALALLLIAALYAAAARRLPVGVFNDDAANILLARSLRHGAYAFPGGFGSPEEYLPAFPLLLVAPVWLLEPRWNLLRAIPLAFAALCLLLTWRLARRFLSPEASAAAVLLTALNPALLAYSGLVLPYLPYLALSLALIDGADAGDRSGFLLLAAGASLAPLLRPQGTVLIACLALAQWHRRGFRRGCVFLFAAMLPSLAWTLRNHLRAGSSLDYVDIWRMHVSALGNAPLLERVAALLSATVGGPFLNLPGPAAAQGAFGALALGTALFGALRLLRKNEDARVFVAASYLAGLVFLHMTWQWIDPRYLIPFVPLLWILILSAWTQIFPEKRLLTGALAAVFAALALPADLSLARRGLGAVQFQPETMAWIRENTPPAARVASMKNYSVALLTGRACAPQVPVPRAGPWLAEARFYGIDYVHLVLPRPGDEFVVADFPDGYQAAFSRWLDARSDAAQVHRNLDEGALVYRLKRGP